ncbi:MAG: hypothetical protein QXL22_03720 [Candidatus Nezhaarchaeales archaeon]
MFSDNIAIIGSDGAAYDLPPPGVGLEALAEKDVRKVIFKLRISYLRWLPYIPLDFGALLSISIERLNQALPGK